MQDTIQREVDRYKQSHIQHGTAYGELDHPSYDSVTFRDLHMATVSHQVRHAVCTSQFLQGQTQFMPSLDCCSANSEALNMMLGICVDEATHGMLHCKTSGPESTQLVNVQHIWHKIAI